MPAGAAYGLAIGFLALGPKMLAEDDPVKQELDIIDEQVDTLGKTFMGMTFGCARCHDHKFDPIPTKDYYALAGIFKSTKTMMNFQNMAEWQERPLVSPDVEGKLKRINAEIKDLQRKRNQVRDTAGEALLGQARLALEATRRIPAEVAAVAGAHLDDAAGHLGPAGFEDAGAGVAVGQCGGCAHRISRVPIACLPVPPRACPAP